MPAPDVQLVIVGSVGIDTIVTPVERRADVLGGSATFACATAAHFARTGMVGVVGADFPATARTDLSTLGIDLAGLQEVDGKTFRWCGEYQANMDERETLYTELNVLEHFDPVLPPAYRQAPFLFMANIGPDVQRRALDQMEAPRFVAMDTMNLWINIQHDNLQDLIRRVNLLTLNESEARHLTGAGGLVEAGEQLLAAGPDYVLIKKGEHGSMLFSKDDLFLLPAYPLRSVRDPTGAGDAFAGALMGVLAAGGGIGTAALRTAMIQASVTASFAVESFGLEKLTALTRDDIRTRVAAYQRMLA